MQQERYGRIHLAPMAARGSGRLERRAAEEAKRGERGENAGRTAPQQHTALEQGHAAP